MLLVLAVGIGGASGALARYGLDRFIEHRVVTVFPWSTFAINVTGCFLAGTVVAALVDRHSTPAWARTRAVVGFLGAYTTFSTFAQETRDLLAQGTTRWRSRTQQVAPSSESLRSCSVPRRAG
jgi:CrcB protein